MRIILIYVGSRVNPTAPLGLSDEKRYHRQMTMNQMDDPPDPAVALFRSLADPARLAILRHLTLGEHRVVDLTNHLGLAQSTTSAHLLCLRDCGLVASRTVGRSSMFSLSVSGELRTLLGSAEQLLAATGNAVSLCPANDGTDPDG